MRGVWLLIFFPLFLQCQVTGTTSAADDIYPGSAWQRIQNPAAEGWDASKLKELKRFIADSTWATGVVVILHGQELFSYGNIKELSYIASCRKSVLSILYGPFVEAGKIDLNRTLAQLGIDDIGGLSDLEKKASIKDLLTARSGVYHPASNPGDAAGKAPTRGTVQPGTRWLYNNWDFNAAGYILEQETGKNIYDLVDSLLAGPLHMQDWDLSAQHKGGDLTKSKYPAYHMWFSTRDMARIGYLMLRNGKWENRQLIPAAWIKTITTIVTSRREAVETKTGYNHFAYGYLWWLWDEPYNNGVYQSAYTAAGAGGQFITVLPKLDLVIAFKTNNKEHETNLARYLMFLHKLVACQD